jgi:hypothetical protein
VILYVNQFEPKETRAAHLAEARDKKMLERHKRTLFTQYSVGPYPRSPQGITWAELFICTMILRHLGPNQLQKLICSSDPSMMNQIGGFVLGMVRSVSQQNQQQQY